MNLNLFNIDEETSEYFEEWEQENTYNVQYGDVYQLGNHRLMCGDSTKLEDINKLLNGAKIDMIFTDPPYNVAFNGRSGNFDVIMNDNLSNEEFSLFIDKIVQNIKALKCDTYYIWCNWKFYGLLQSKLDFTSCIVWAKKYIWYGYKLSTSTRVLFI